MSSAAMKFGAIVVIVVAVGWYKLSTHRPKPGPNAYDECVRNKSFQGKVAIVTGSTSGIGKQIASELYQHGATVILASRNPAKLSLTEAELRAAFPESAGWIESRILDTSDFDSVREFAAWFHSTHDKLSFLVNNAGIQYFSMAEAPGKNLSAPILSKQGYDLSYATNYMGGFLLAELLMPALEKESQNGGGRIVNLASGFHMQSDGTRLLVGAKEQTHGMLPPAADGNTPGVMHRVWAYGESKVAQVLHAKELNRRIAERANEESGTRVRAFSVCPGWVSTPFLGTDLVMKVVSSLAYSQAEGSLSAMCALADNSLRGGEHLTNYRFDKPYMGLLDTVLQAATRYGMRDLVATSFAGGLATFQKLLYGCHVTDTSSVGSNQQLAADLYDWTMREFSRMGYVNTPFTKETAAEVVATTEG